MGEKRELPKDIDPESAFSAEAYGGHGTRAIVIYAPNITQEAWDALCALGDYPCFDDAAGTRRRVVRLLNDTQRILQLERALRHIAETCVCDPDVAQFAARSADNPPSAFAPWVDEVCELARQYVTDVTTRKAAGDANAEYHAREIKIRAHNLLLASGFTPRETVEAFQDEVEKLMRGAP